MSHHNSSHTQWGATTPPELGPLLESQKTELVGQLAGAMANQFNNIMMALTSCVELEIKAAGPAQKRNLEKILTHAADATFLIQKLLAFSRKQALTPRSCELNSAVRDVSRLLGPLVGEDITVSVTLDEAIGTVLLNSVELEQIVLSLGVNARDAMSQGGSLEVKTELVSESPDPQGSNELSGEGPFAVLSVCYKPAANGNTRDSASVADQELRFTQAIAAVRGIVRERRGLLRASTRPGHGTTFRVYFPASHATRRPEESGSPSIIAPASTKTVLIVDDDDAVRNPAAEFLKMEGFKVLQACTGPEALRIVEESRSRVDILVTDIVMAGMHGNAVADELKRAHHNLRVLYMSGDADKAGKISQEPDGRHHAVLQKPFRLNRLIETIHQLLGE
jgi:two-component system, cell cycle sensor histidine kinase and response regulator CckA